MASPAVKLALDSSSKFSTNFMKEVTEGEANLVCSPLSAMVVLAMAHAGAKGKTAEVMAAGLCLPSDLKAAQEGLGELVDELENAENVNLFIANRIYVHSDFAVKPEYLTLLKKAFDASAENVKFDKTTTTAINKWVAKETSNKIKRLVPQGSLDNSRLVLVNAVYFKGSWLKPFQGSDTREQPFYLDGTETIMVPFMRQYGVYFSYAKLADLDAQLVEMPYKNPDLSLVLVVPNNLTGLVELEKQLATSSVAQLLQSAKETEINLYLPKFKLESTLYLQNCLARMGMGQIFLDEADFSGISSSEPLKVSKVIQKAFIEISERGTTAAAATYDTMEPTCGPEDEKEEIFVHCDRPFLFFLAYKRESVLFAGRVENPAES